MNNPGSNGYTRNRYYENGKKIDSWMQNGRGLEGAKDVLSIDPSRHVDSRLVVSNDNDTIVCDWKPVQTKLLIEFMPDVQGLVKGVELCSFCDLTSS